MKQSVGGVAFTSKKAIVDHCRGIIRSTVDRVEASHETFLFGLLRRHPRYDAEWGSRIEYFVVDHDRMGGNSGLGFVRYDGRREVFSFLKCASGRDFTPFYLFTKACREAVEGSICISRSRMFSGLSVVPCAVTGEPVTEDECHVDHADPPFRDIRDAFCEVHDWEAMALVSRPDGCGVMFAEPADALRFRRFHDKRAVLQITTKAANSAKR